MWNYVTKIDTTQLENDILHLYSFKRDSSVKYTNPLICKVFKNLLRHNSRINDLRHRSFGATAPWLDDLAKLFVIVAPRLKSLHMELTFAPLAQNVSLLTPGILTDAAIGTVNWDVTKEGPTLQAIQAFMERCGPGLKYLKLDVDQKNLTDYADLVANHTGSLCNLNLDFGFTSEYLLSSFITDAKVPLSKACLANSSTLKRTTLGGWRRPIPTQYLRYVNLYDADIKLPYNADDMQSAALENFGTPLSGLRFCQAFSVYCVFVYAYYFKYPEMNLKDFDALFDRCFLRDQVDDRAAAIARVLSLCENARTSPDRCIKDGTAWMREKLKQLILDATEVYGAVCAQVLRLLTDISTMQEKTIYDDIGDLKFEALQLLKDWIVADRYILRLTERSPNVGLLLNQLFSDRKWVDENNIDVNTTTTSGSAVIWTMIESPQWMAPLIRHPTFDWFVLSSHRETLIAAILDSNAHKPFILALGPTWRTFVSNEAIVRHVRRIGFFSEMQRFIENVEFFHYERLEAEGRDLSTEIVDIFWMDLIETEKSIPNLLRGAGAILKVFAHKSRKLLFFLQRKWTPLSSVVPIDEAHQALNHLRSKILQPN